MTTEDMDLDTDPTEEEAPMPLANAEDWLYPEEIGDDPPATSIPPPANNSTGIRQHVWMTGTGDYFYLPSTLDLRAHFGLPTGEERLPRRIFEDSHANFALLTGKFVFVDWKRRTAYWYSSSFAQTKTEKKIHDDGSVEEVEVRGRAYSDLQTLDLTSARPVRDQEIRRILETRTPPKGFKGTGADGVERKYRHKRGIQLYDFDADHPLREPSRVVDLLPGRGAPAFVYAIDSNFRAAADAWIEEVERAYAFDVEIPDAKRYGQAGLYCPGMSRTGIGAQYVALKLAQEHARDFPAWVRAYNEQRDRFRNAQIKDAPKVPHLRPSFRALPHQAKVLAVAQHQPALLEDVSAGGGKLAMALMDSLVQLAMGNVSRPAIAMPGNLLLQQKQQIHGFTNNVNVICLDSDVWNRYGRDWLKDLILNAPPNTLILFSYDWLVLEGFEINEDGGRHYPHAHWLIEQCRVDMVTLDESHFVKNEDSQRAQSVVQMSSYPNLKVRRAMTGTMYPNELQDVFLQAAFVDPAVFGSLENFGAAYGQIYTRRKIQEYKPAAPKAIQKKLHDTIGIQVTRAHWLHLLPPNIHRTYHPVRLSSMQQAAYTRILRAEMDAILNPEEGQFATAADFRKALQLKKAWEDYLALPEEQRKSAEMSEAMLGRLTRFEQFLGCPTTDLVLGHSTSIDAAEKISPKVQGVDALLDEHFADPANGKVLVFCRYSVTAEHLREHSRYRDMSLYYDASFMEHLSAFEHDPDVKVLFAVDHSLRVGHNMQFVNRIIRVEQPWAPADVEQPDARALRFGNKHASLYLDAIVTDGTAEIAKTARLISKKHLIAKAATGYDDNDTYNAFAMTLDTMLTVTDFARDLGDHIHAERKIDAYERRESARLSKEYGKETYALADLENPELPGARTIQVPLLAKGDEDPNGVWDSQTRSVIERRQERELLRIERAEQKEERAAIRAEKAALRASKRSAYIPLALGVVQFADDLHVCIHAKADTLPQLAKLKKKYQTVWQPGYYLQRAYSKKRALWVLKMLRAHGVAVLDRPALRTAIEDARKLPETRDSEKLKRPGDAIPPITRAPLECYLAKVDRKWHLVIPRDRYTESAPVRDALKRCGFQSAAHLRGYITHPGKLRTAKDVAGLLRGLHKLQYEVEDPEAFLDAIEARLPDSRTLLRKKMRNL